MGDAGFRFPGCLDPRAEEFRPRFAYPGFGYPHDRTPLFQPTQLFFPYPTPTFHYAHLPPPAHVSAPAVPPPPPMQEAAAAATRTVLLSSVPRGVSESEVRRSLEVFGDVRAVQMERLRREGTVTVNFYDLRHAVEAAREVREQHMQHQTRVRGHFEAWSWGNFGAPPYVASRGVILGQEVWAEFASPNMAGVPEGYNQGTVVVFNLDPNFSSKSLKELFEPFGDVKELRETPTKSHQRFVEFYDIRDAAKAYSQLNGKEIHGTQMVIEFSRPGGNKKHFHKSFPKSHNIRAQNPADCPQPARQNSYSSQTRKPSSNGSSNGSEKCFQKQNSKKEKQVCSGNPKHASKNKGWSFKGRQPRCLDSKFLINEDGIVDSGVSDLRTTVMIKNIPNKYSQKLLMNMLDNHCIHCNEKIASSGNDEPLSSYDFVYLPIDFVNKCNVGYGFVNMTSPVAALRLYKAFHHQTWEVYNSKKICEVTYARLQGLEALKEHFRSSKFPCAAEEYLPVVFSPPRDGRHLSEPVQLAGGRSATPNSPSPPNTSCSHQTLTDDDGNVSNDGAADDDDDDDSDGGGSQ